MFILRLFDRNGIELFEGDYVRISNRKKWTFYAEVKYLESEGIIAPFHTFCFHSMEKVEDIPENAVRSSEERYEVYWIGNNADIDKEAQKVDKYLADWRICESNIDKRMWRITKQNEEIQGDLFDQKP